MSEKVLRAYRVSDYEIYAGWDYESAVAAAMEDSGCERSDYDEESPALSDDYELTDTDEHERPIGQITVQKVIARDLTEPGLVASSY